MRRVLVLGIALTLAGCQSTFTPAQNEQLAVTDTCQTNAAVVSALADLRAMGKLSAKQISMVDADIALIDPICSGNPSGSLSGDAASAAVGLAQILAQMEPKK